MKPTKGETPKAATDGASSVKNPAVTQGVDMANDSKQLTIIAAANVDAPVAVMATLVVGQLIEAVEGIDTAMSEGKNGADGQYWPDTKETTACDYTVRSVRDRLQSIVGRTFDNMGDLLYEIYHVMEPLRLVAMVAPKTSRAVTYRLELAIRDYDALSNFMDSVSVRNPAQPRQDPEVRRARRRAKSQEVIA